MIPAQETAKAEIAKLFQGLQFVVVSNREPYEHRLSKDKKSIRSHFMGGGVVRALDPIMQQLRGVWVAWGSGNADRDVVDSQHCVRVPEQGPAYTLKRVFLSHREVEGSYYGFSNQFLWPFCHNMLQLAKFSQAQWEMYKQVNEIFANHTIEVIKKKSALIWLHDYHLALAAQHIRERLPQTVILLFWHIPWPSPEVFLQFGKAREFLRGMLCNDVVAFHSPSYVSHFLESVKRALGLKIRGTKIAFGSRQVTVCSHPISIDTESWMEQVRQVDAQREFRRYQLQHLYDLPLLAVGVDRLDYTKGLVRKARAWSRLLDRYPQFKGKIVLLQKTMASRSRIKSYQDYAAAFMHEVEKVNKKHGRGSWKPVLHISREVSHAFLLSIYKRGDVCLVTPVIDGLNLVAKEYIASKADRPGVLVLSKYAGANQELIGQIETDPYDLERMAQDFYQAITMPQEIKKLRCKKLLAKVRKNNIFVWLISNLKEALPYVQAVRQ